MPCPRRFHPQYFDKNRCNTGKPQSKWIAKDGNAAHGEGGVDALWDLGSELRERGLDVGAPPVRKSRFASAFRPPPRLLTLHQRCVTFERAWPLHSQDDAVTLATRPDTAGQRERQMLPELGNRVGVHAEPLVDPEVAVGDGRAEGGLVATAILDTHVAVFSWDVTTGGALAIGLVEPVRVDSLKQCDVHIDRLTIDPYITIDH
jgi:hypothetical protein